MTITRGRRRLIMVIDAAAITVSLVLWWRSGSWVPLVGAGCGLVSFVMAAARPVDERRPRP